MRNVKARRGCESLNHPHPLVPEGPSIEKSNEESEDLRWGVLEPPAVTGAGRGGRSNGRLCRVF